jgi:carbonic anhydrase
LQGGFILSKGKVDCIYKIQKDNISCFLFELSILDNSDKNGIVFAGHKQRIFTGIGLWPYQKRHIQRRYKMSKILDEVLGANAKYAANFGSKGDLAMPPVRHFAILTCMDARLDPAKYAGLAEGDAHVIRNAGGRASDDAIRSLVISYKLLGTIEWFVIHHTNCGMEFFSDDLMRDMLASSLDAAALDASGFHDVGKGPGSTEGEFIDWLTIKDPVKSVTADILRIRKHPLVPKNIPIYGYIYDVKTGNLIEVPEATKVGKPL